MAMDDETKARLKEARDRKRGRNSLQGLDQTLGLVGLDYVQDMGDDVPRVRYERSGYLYYPHPSGHMTSAVNEDGIPTRRFHHLRAGWESRRASAPCPWVLFRYTPPWVAREMANRWDSRRVVTSTYGGPGVRIVKTAVAVPADVAVAWLRFLWPEPTEWGPRARRYLVGVTEGYTQAHPGEGAKVRMETDHVSAHRGCIYEVMTVNTAGDCYIRDEMGEAWQLIPSPRQVVAWTVVG